MDFKDAYSTRVPEPGTRGDASHCVPRLASPWTPRVCLCRTDRGLTVGSGATWRTSRVLVPRRTTSDRATRAFGRPVRVAQERREKSLETVARRIPRLDPAYLAAIEGGSHAVSIVTRRPDCRRSRDDAQRSSSGRWTYLGATGMYLRDHEVTRVAPEPGLPVRQRQSAAIEDA